MDPASWSAFLIPLATGGVFGSIITAILTDRRNRREYAVKLIEKYIDKVYDQMVDVTDALKYPKLMRKNWNKVTAVANWYELVAHSYVEGLADAKMLERMGYPEECRNFFAKIRAAKTLNAQKQEIDAYTLEDLQTFRYLNWISSPDHCPVRTLYERGL